MSYDVNDTIAAIASATGGAARGIVRISGADAVARLTSRFTPDSGEDALTTIRAPRRIRGFIRVCDSDVESELNVPGDLLLWPSTRSYTREPSAEFHTIGSPPLLAAVIEQLGRAGVRPAEPGEFTLRAFLAGRVDLTQAEAVLGVIDARDRNDLDAALDQLAGGLSRPLHRLREELLGVLAELEAGLDFVDEDIEFISREALRARLESAREIVAITLTQLSSRDARTEVPRVAITGPPNAGKSSLFNALVERYSDGVSAAAIVSPHPGATRDYIGARLNLNGAACEIVDTAGIDDGGQHGIHLAAQQSTAQQQRAANLQLCCVDATTIVDGDVWATERTPQGASVLVITKVDKVDEGVIGASVISCSSLTGYGIDILADRISAALRESDAVGVVGAAATSARCLGSLREASQALDAAVELTEDAGDELVAAEIRSALDALGEVVGAICTDDVLDRVFSQFCIGK
jgi:tRNA modification GTPase